MSSDSDDDVQVIVVDDGTETGAAGGVTSPPPTIVTASSPTVSWDTSAIFTRQTSLSLAAEFELGEASGSSVSEDSGTEEQPMTHKEVAAALLSPTATEEKQETSETPSVPRNPAEWTTDQVADWLTGLSFLFEPYAKAFREAKVDGVRLLSLSPDDLSTLGVGDQTHLRYIVALLKRVRRAQTTPLPPLPPTKAPDPSTAPAPPLPPQDTPPAAPPPLPPSGSAVPQLPPSPPQTQRTAVTPPLPPQTQPRDHVAEQTLLSTVAEGAFFVKHGRHGKPKLKFVCVSLSDSDHAYRYHVIWAPSADLAFLKREGMDSRCRSLPLSRVTEVVIGKQTGVFRRKAASEAPFQCCVSLVLPDRTLDLQASTAEEARLWAHALSVCISRAREAADSEEDSEQT